MSKDKREYERKDSLNLIDYIIKGKDGSPVSRGMGRTLNLSEKGILLETHVRMEHGQELVLTIGLKDEIVEIKGVVTHGEACGTDGFCAGIEFKEMGPEDKEIVKKYLEAFKSST